MTWLRRVLHSLGLTPTDKPVQPKVTPNVAKADRVLRELEERHGAIRIVVVRNRADQAMQRADRAAFPRHQ